MNRLWLPTVNQGFGQVQISLHSSRRRREYAEFDDLKALGVWTENKLQR